MNDYYLHMFNALRTLNDTHCRTFFDLFPLPPLFFFYFILQSFRNIHAHRYTVNLHLHITSTLCVDIITHSHANRKSRSVHIRDVPRSAQPRLLELFFGSFQVPSDQKPSFVVSSSSALLPAAHCQLSSRDSRRPSHSATVTVPVERSTKQRRQLAVQPQYRDSTGSNAVTEPVVSKRKI